MVEINCETGEPRLLKLVAVDDAGHLINPLIVEGRIHGGLAQGIGQALVEEVVYDEHGQLLAGSLLELTPCLVRPTSLASSCVRR